jgi:hypothetical protein
MNEAEKAMALRMVGLIIEYYLPSIRGGVEGGGAHTQEIWGKIRAEIESVDTEKEG